MKIKFKNEIMNKHELEAIKKRTNSMVKEFKKGGNGHPYTLYTGKQPRILLIGRSILINFSKEESL